MIAAAEKDGLLRPGMTVVDATSGNTGIALANICSPKDYRLILTMPEDASGERRKILKVLDAMVVLTPASEGMAGAHARARAIAAAHPKAFFADQFSNPANAGAHYLGTGPEIWADTDGEVAAIVAGIGTGATITGAGRFLKERNPSILTVGVEPAQSATAAGGSAGYHRLAGLGPGFVPKALDLSVVDELATVTDEEAAETTRRLAAEEGLFCGFSSGAAAATALKVAARPEMAGRLVVAILPDGGERYLSTPLFRL